DYQDGPERGVHPATFRIPVHIGDQKEHASQEQRSTGRHSRRSQKGQRRLVLEIWRKHRTAVAERVDVHDHGDGLSRKEEENDDYDQPSRNDAELLPKTEVLLLPPKPDQPDSFVE